MKVFSFCAVLLFVSSFYSAFAGSSDSDCCPPDYNKTVMESYRKLVNKTSVYETAPKAGEGVRLAIYQAQAAYGPGATAKNLALLEEIAQKASVLGAQLLSFPELYLTGYTLSPKEAKAVAEFKDGVSITKACEIAKRFNMAMLVPYAEKAEVDGSLKYYDSIAIIDEKGNLVSSYKKTHLYAQQERDNWSFGNEPPPVFYVNRFPVGVLNCYENEFPELSRMLALKGAKLIVGPTAADCYYTLTNGKRSAVPYPDVSTILLPAMAYTNNVFYAYSNRAGYEKRDGNEWHYRGNSIIIGPHGDTIVKAGHQQDTLLVADCIPSYYGMTHPEADYSYLKDRRPAMYGPLVSPTAEFEKGFVYPKYENGVEMPVR